MPRVRRGADPDPRHMTVLHLASEYAPVAKAGGLADVLAALPAALQEAGVHTAVVLPLYGGPGGEKAVRAGELDPVWSGAIPGTTLRPTVWRTRSEPAVFYVEEPVHFGRSEIYADEIGEELAPERFVAFQRAVLAWLRDDADARPDVLHLHDHHAALVPALLRGVAANEALAELPTVLTVHTAVHQGIVPLRALAALGLDEAFLLASHASADPEDELNTLRLGIELADAVAIPSTTYARELVTDFDVARGLGRVFRAAADRMVGIAHGVDRSVWNPRSDAFLPAPYGPGDLAGKRLAKREVCAELGLDAAQPLLAYIGRLVPEKGIEILFETVERLARRTDASVVVLGEGPPEQEARLRGLDALLRASGLHGRLAVALRFDEALAHRLYAAADAVLIPSRTEPGGLTAMHAMAYGTVPIARAVGGMRDTVCPAGAPPRGVCFEAFTTTALTEAVQEALELWADGPAWAALQARGLAAEFSWRPAAEAYADLYHRVAAGHPVLDADEADTAVFY